MQVAYDHTCQIDGAKDQGAIQDEAEIPCWKSDIDQPPYDQGIEERKSTANNHADQIYGKQRQHGACLAGKPPHLRRHRFPSCSACSLPSAISKKLNKYFFSAVIPTLESPRVALCSS